MLGRGEAFGELGLSEGAPRSASVRALERSELFEISKGTFDQLLARMVHVPAFAPTLQRMNELKALPAFRHLEPDELGTVLEHGEWRNYPPGEAIVREGDVGDAFYAIASGRADVRSREGAARELGAGDHFGEIALLLDVPRTATVTARTPLRAYRLTREGFDRIVAASFRTGTLNPAVTPDTVWQH